MSPPSSPVDLTEQIRLLRTENERLSTLANDFSLLGMVAEKIASASTPDRVISIALEQIASCKGIEFCLFGSVNEKEITITHSHATSHPLAATQPILMVIPLPTASIPADNHVCSEEEAEKILAIITSISPGMAEIIRSSICLIRRRFFGEISILILADTRPRQELLPLEPMMNRVADIIVTRLDSLVLHESLQTVNRALETKVKERTTKLLKLNDALQHEIHDRKKAEMGLRDSETRYRTLVDNLPLGVSVIDANNRIAMINRTQAEWFGKPTEHFSGTLCYERFEGRHHPCADCPGAIALRTGQPAITEREETLHNSQQITVRIRTVPLPNGNEPPTSYIEVIEDITELKAKEKKQLRFMRKLQHTQKLESLGVLAGGIAHDFNNILMVILGHAELAKMTLPPTTPVLGNLVQIELAAKKAAALSHQMLAFSGKGQFVIEILDLNRLITDMAHMLEVSISKKAELHFNLSQELPSVEVDATQLRQVLMNLVINASEAIGDQRGTITISTGLMIADQDYLEGSWLDENLEEGLYVFIEVADTGCGMDPETAKRVCEPFFTTKFTGRGLGMAATLGIIRGHNGTIRVNSVLNKGTTFKVILPASPKHPIVAPQNSRQSTPTERSGAILLVDDEKTLLTLGQDMLQKLGYQVITAEDGLQALEQYRANPDSIVAVLLDLAMPHMDGVETFRELRKICPDIRIIISSGYNEQEIRQRFAKNNNFEILQKPYNISELQAVLTKALGKNHEDHTRI